METLQDNGGGGNGEVKQIHIVYFLSRKGVIEQPHLLNFHFSGDGIRLRDVKRSLAELRGKDMPDSFAWSFKRLIGIMKYKYGCYVWQDLIDEDLITPISDNEYVLKGSQISSSTTSTSTPQDSEECFSMQKEGLVQEPNHSLSREIKKEQPERKLSSEIEEESPKSTLTDDSMKSEEDAKNSETGLNDGDDSSFSSSTLNLNLFRKKPKKTTHRVTMKKTKPVSSEKSFAKSKTHGNNHGASQIFRSFINCRTVNTKDSVVPPANRKLNEPSSNNSYDVEAKKNESAQICRSDDKLLGGSQRIDRKKYPWEKPQIVSRKSCDGVTETTAFCGPRSSFAAYMPVSRPNCSQCERKFKPEKLHSHMKSCKGIKAAAAKGTKPANHPAKSADKPATVIESRRIHSQSTSSA
ncbi:hypothetical protein LIER_10325 [Lithospermum erythrorhizon]|uniref:SOSEKI DIX-like domain-containing protein n=1 Tax=Lithospermum erythrorhizon TaxID=34254 RepID=A0AAV3PNU4_LITER